MRWFIRTLVAVALDAVLRQKRAMSGDDGVEIQLEDLVEHLSPTRRAGAVAIVEHEHAFGDEVASVITRRSGE